MNLGFVAMCACAIASGLGHFFPAACSADVCYDPPQLFFTPSEPSPPSGTLALPAPPVPQPLQPLPIQPATMPGSPMQVDPANVPLPPTTERTPDDQLWLPSDATALYQPPLVIHMQPPGQLYHSQALGGEPISPERSALHQSLLAMFNAPVPPHAYIRPTSPMDAISKSQSRRDESCRSPSEPSIPSTRSQTPEAEEPHCGFTKGRNTADYKDPAHPEYLTMQWHHVPAADHPVHSAINQERRARHYSTSQTPSLDLSPPSSNCSPQLKDIPEGDLPVGEDIPKPPEAVSPLMGPVPGSFTLDGPQPLL